MKGQELQLITEKMQKVIKNDFIVPTEILLPSGHELVSMPKLEFDRLQRQVRAFMQVTGWIMWNHPEQDPLYGRRMVLRPPLRPPNVTQGQCEPKRARKVESRIVEPKMLE